MDVNMQNLSELVHIGQQLQEMLENNPQVLEYLRLAQETGGHIVMAPVKVDKLIEAKEAAEILKVPVGRIGEYVKSGLLQAYVTPPTTNRKFWVSDVLAIPKKVA